MRAERQMEGAGPTRPAFSTPRYSLRKHFGLWQLTFEGQSAILKHQQGLEYVAFLLTHPPKEPMHALALALRATDALGPSSATPGPTTPSTRTPLLVEGPAKLTPFDLLLEEARAAWSVRRRQLQLEALLDADDQSEPVKAEAQRELKAIYDQQKLDFARLTEVARCAVRTVRGAIERVQRRLSAAVDLQGRPDSLLRAFGAHLEECLLLASARCAAGSGSFTYRPPAGVTWASDSTANER
jgi:hypothetical protein